MDFLLTPIVLRFSGQTQNRRVPGQRRRTGRSSFRVHPADANSLAESTSQPSEDPVSFPGGQRLQTDGTAESASSNSESSNSENNSENVESAPAGPVLDIPAESLESKENEDPESQESFTLPAGK